MPTLMGRSTRLVVAVEPSGVSIAESPVYRTSNPPPPQVFHDVDEGVKGYLEPRDMLRALMLIGVLDGYTRR